MDRGKRTTLAAWGLTTIIVAAAGFLAYRNLTALPELEGRGELDRVLDDPARLLEDPGILGAAVERRAYLAVRDCMTARGFDYLRPALATELAELADPQYGYGIATGGSPGREVVLPDHAPTGAAREAYEEALYGTSLDAASGVSGCAAAGQAELSAGAATLASLPYSIERLEADALAHPAYASAQAEWGRCMAGRGWSYSSPDDIVADLTARLATVRGDAARALADEERQIAADDFACRERTIDPALEEVAADIVPAFVAANRSELETLLPPSAGDLGLPQDLGGGDVQVTLRWSGEADLDLEVIDPDGERIYFGDRTSASGGTLDRDANYAGGCSPDPNPIENVFWPPDGAPAGSYIASVIHRGCAGTASFELIVQVRGRVVERVTRSIDSGGEFSVDFEVGR